jgi:hypothetical protein
MIQAIQTRISRDIVTVRKERITRKFLHLAVGAAAPPAVMRIASADLSEAVSDDGSHLSRGQRVRCLGGNHRPQPLRVLRSARNHRKRRRRWGINGVNRVATAAPDGYQFVHGGTDTFTQSQIALQESRLGAMP